MEFQIEARRTSDIRNTRCRGCVGHIEHLPRHFCFESQGCFVFGNDAQRHANKDTQQIAEHRLSYTTAKALVIKQTKCFSKL